MEKMMTKTLYPIVACLAVVAALSGCGSGGAKMEPDFILGPPLPPTPALTTGTYDGSGAVYQTTDATGAQTGTAVLASGEVRIAVDSANNRYTLTFNRAVFPGLLPDSGALSYNITDQRFGHSYQVASYTNGVRDGLYTTEGKGGGGSRSSQANGDPASTQFFTVTGESHVSLGYWSYATPTKDAGVVLFAYGDRTPSSAIPVSGTATYQVVESLGTSYDDDFTNIDIKLKADFGTQAMSADIAYVKEQKADAFRTAVAGSAPIRPAGDFDIALNGTKQAGSWDTSRQMFVPGTTPAAPVAGNVSGAFFGPDASQIGATVRLPNPFGGTIAEAWIAVKN